MAHDATLLKAQGARVMAWASAPVPAVGCLTGPEDPKQRTSHISLLLGVLTLVFDVKRNRFTFCLSGEILHWNNMNL